MNTKIFINLLKAKIFVISVKHRLIVTSPPRILHQIGASPAPGTHPMTSNPNAKGFVSRRSHPIKNESYKKTIGRLLFCISSFLGIKFMYVHRH